MHAHRRVEPPTRNHGIRGRGQIPRTKGSVPSQYPSLNSGLQHLEAAATDSIALPAIARSSRGTARRSTVYAILQPITPESVYPCGSPAMPLVDRLSMRLSRVLRRTCCFDRVNDDGFERFRSVRLLGKRGDSISSAFFRVIHRLIGLFLNLLHGLLAVLIARDTNTGGNFQ